MSIPTYFQPEGERHRALHTLDPTDADRQAASASPLSRLVRHRTRSAVVEHVLFPEPGASVVLFSQAGAGEVRSLWIAAGTGNLMLDAHIQVFVDGESTPSIDMDMGTFLVWHGISSTAPGQTASTQHVSTGVYRDTTTSGNRGFATLRFPMPFSNGIRIQVTNPTATPAGSYRLFSITHWSDVASPFPVRLRGAGRGFSSTNPPLAAVAETDLVTIAGRGHLVWLSYFGNAATDYTWLERNLDTYVDGEATPSLSTSGTEDYFFNGWYYGKRTSYSMPHALVMQANNAQFSAHQATDWLAATGGLRFEKSLRVHLGTEALVATAHNWSCSALWYERVGPYVLGLDDVPA